MERLDLKDKLRTFINDKAQKLLSPGSGEREESDLSTLLPPGTRLDRTEGWSDSDREVRPLPLPPLHLR